MNEIKFSEIPAQRENLRELLKFISDQPIRMVVSCRDVFWTQFADPRGQSYDFWWNRWNRRRWVATCMRRRRSC
jgi:hypothetical protein